MRSEIEPLPRDFDTSRPPAEVTPRGPGTLDELYRAHARYVARVAARMLGRDDDLDDVVQDVFLRAQAGFRDVRDPAALRGWLATIAVRVVARKLQMRRVRAFFRIDRDADYEVVASSEATAEQRVLLAQIYGVLDRLPVNERIAWTLRFVELEQIDRIAVMCECSMATVKRRVEAAQRAIREAVGDE